MLGIELGDFVVVGEDRVSCFGNGASSDAIEPGV